MQRSLITALLTFSLLAASPVMAQPVFERAPSITMRGDGQSQAKPDIARLSAEVVTRGKTLQAASEAHKARAQKAVEAIRALEADGVTIEQSNFRLDQIRQPAPMAPAPNTPSEIEYQAVTSFEIRGSKLDRIDAALAALAASGLFEIRNLRFALDDNNAALEAARRNAVLDARARAKTYAEAAGVTLGEVIEITDSEPRLLRNMAAPMSAAFGMQVAPPDAIDVTATISMSWRIARP